MLHWLSALLLFIGATALTMWLDRLGLPTGALATTSALCYGAIIAYLCYSHRRRFAAAWRAFFQPSDLAIAGADGPVLASLRSYANPHSNIMVVFWSNLHRPFAERIIAIFQLAGWDVSFANVPQEMHNPQYFAGIEVQGYNSHLVKVVAEAVAELGGWEVRTKTDEPQVKKDSPKWPRVHHSVRVTIGHRTK